MGVKLNFQGRIGVVGGSGEQGIWRSSESCFSEKQFKKKKKKRLSFPTRLVISVALCQYTLTFLSLKKDIKKRIPPRIYRYHPPCNELMISGMVLKHL